MDNRGETQPQSSSSSAPGRPASSREVVQGGPPQIWQVILIALVAIVFTAIWLGLYNLLSDAIWPSNFVTARRWTIPLGVLAFSLVVGLAQKYLRAPTVVHGGGLAESLKGGGKVDYTTFPGALLSSYASLLSGASVGPEGPLGVLVQD